MITEFNLESCRDSAVIYSSVLEQIQTVYDADPALAGELAIAAIQTVICGEPKSDNAMVRALLSPLKQSATKNKQRYEKARQSKRAAKIRDLRLEEIAALAAQGKSARQIESELGIPKSTVSYRLGVIKSEYPALMEGVSKVSNCPTCPTHVYDYVYDYDYEYGNENDTALSDKPKAGVAFGNAPREETNDSLVLSFEDCRDNRENRGSAERVAAICGF